MKRLQNQEGFVTVVTVLVATMALTITLLSIYVYVINRSRHYARIKEAYKLIDVMAGAAKDIRYAWDLSSNTAVNDNTSCCNTIIPVSCPVSSNGAKYGGNACGGTCAPTTTACVKDIAFNSAINPPPDACNPGNAACCALCPQPSGTVASMCFDNPDNSSQPYCFYRLLENKIVQYKIMAPKQFSEPTRIDKFVAKLDLFFEGGILEDGPHGRRDMKDVVAVRAPTFWQWAFAERKTLAANPGPHSTGPCCGNPITAPPDYKSTIPASPSCLYQTASNGCMSCGPGTGRQCSVIVACPLSFAPCATWDGLASDALFGQEFVMEPPGVCYTGGVLNLDPSLCF